MQPAEKGLETADVRIAVVVRGYPNHDVRCIGRNSNDYVTFSADVGAFGVGLTAQSGASTWVDMHWHFTQNSGTRYLCGHNDFPTSADRIFAGT